MYFSWNFLTEHKFIEKNKNGQNGSLSHILFISKGTQRFNSIGEVDYVSFSEIISKFKKSDYEMIGENLYKMLCNKSIYVFNISLEDDAGYVLSGNFTERTVGARTRLIEFQFSYADSIEKSYLREKTI